MSDLERQAEDRTDQFERGFQYGIREATYAERQRCLAIARAAIGAAAVDGRDLVVRTDIIRKIEQPTSPILENK